MVINISIEKTLLEMLIKGEIMGYSIEGYELKIFVKKNNIEIVNKIRELFSKSKYNVTIFEIEEVSME